MNRPARILALGLIFAVGPATRAHADSTVADAVQFAGCAPAWVESTRALISIELAANPASDASRLTAIDIRVTCTLVDYRIVAFDRWRAVTAERTLATEADEEDGRHVALVLAELLTAAERARTLAAEAVAASEAGALEAAVFGPPGLWRHTLGAAGSVLRFSGELGMSPGGGLDYEVNRGTFGFGVAFDAHSARRTLQLGTVDVTFVGLAPLGVARWPISRHFVLATLGGPSLRFVRMDPSIRAAGVEATQLNAVVWSLFGQVRAEVLVGTHGTLCLGATLGYVATPPARGSTTAGETLVAGGLWQMLSAGWSWRF